MIKINSVRSIPLFLFLSLFHFLNAQNEISWTFVFDENEEQLVMIAKLKENWHLYSQYIDENAGPVATTFTFDENDEVDFVGKVEEPIGNEVYDKNFGTYITYFSDEVVFKQNLQKVNEKTSVKGSVLYMVCDDSSCLPPDVVDFEIEINVLEK